MYIYMCVCVYIYIYIYTYICLYTCNIYNTYDTYRYVAQWSNTSELDEDQMLPIHMCK